MEDSLPILGQPCVLCTLAYSDDDEHDDIARSERIVAAARRKGSKVDDLTKVQLSLTNCPVRGPYRCTLKSTKKDKKRVMSISEQGLILKMN